MATLAVETALVSGGAARVGRCGEDRLWSSPMTPLQRHVFVCVNEREAGSSKGCCQSKGGSAVRDAFKKQLARQKLLDVVRPNKSGCLDQCEHGVVVVVYPEQVWYGGVKLEDVQEIVEEHILKGVYVQRLLIPGQEHLLDQKGPALRLSVVGTDSGEA